MFQLGVWKVNPLENSLVHDDGSRRELTPRAMNLLAYFAEHQGEILSNTEIIEHVWSATEVSESVIYKGISEIRAALGDIKRPYDYLKTVPKRGYELICEAQSLTETQPVSYTHLTLPTIYSV